MWLFSLFLMFPKVLQVLVSLFVHLDLSLFRSRLRRHSSPSKGSPDLVQRGELEGRTSHTISDMLLIWNRLGSLPFSTHTVRLYALCTKGAYAKLPVAKPIGTMALFIETDAYQESDSHMSLHRKEL